MAKKRDPLSYGEEEVESTYGEVLENVGNLIQDLKIEKNKNSLLVDMVSYLTGYDEAWGDEGVAGVMIQLEKTENNEINVDIEKFCNAMVQEAKSQIKENKK